MPGFFQPPTSLARQADAFARAIFPAGFLVVLMVLASLPSGLPGLVPAVTLPCVFFWSVFRPAALPPPTVFGIGLMQDLLTQAPLGSSVLPLLIGQGIALRWRGWLLKLSFLMTWLVFGAVAAGAATLTWLLQTVLGWRLLPFMPSVYEAMLSAGLYPLLSYVLARALQGMRRAEGAV